MAPPRETTSHSYPGEVSYRSGEGWKVVGRHRCLGLGEGSEAVPSPTSLQALISSASQGIFRDLSCSSRVAVKHLAGKRKEECARQCPVYIRSGVFTVPGLAPSSFTYQSTYARQPWACSALLSILQITPREPREVLRGVAGYRVHTQ